MRLFLHVQITQLHLILDRATIKLYYHMESYSPLRSTCYLLHSPWLNQFAWCFSNMNVSFFHSKKIRNIFLTLNLDTK